MRYIFIFFLSCLTVLISWINIGLHPKDQSRAEQKKDVRLQLNFLETELKQKNLGVRMQQLFPEGYVFIHALYGLSWCELAIADSAKNKELHQKALTEALYALERINSEEGAAPFSIELSPQYGIYYSGWKNYLLSKILQVDHTFKNHAFYEKMYTQQCKEIIQAAALNESPYPESYYGHAWPADMFVAMASVSNHDKLYAPVFQADIKSWLKKVKRKLDPKTKLIPHKVDAVTASTIEGARGCSIGLSLRMLGEIDPVFGIQQYGLMKEKFSTTQFGLPAVREYPKGTFGLGDVDSGPVIFGVGFAATIVSVGTMSMYNDAVLASQQYKTIHAFGFETENQQDKKYLFGALPMADAFIAWSRATDLNSNTTQPNISSGDWRNMFHLISIVLLLVLWLPFYKMKIKASINQLRKKPTS